MYYGLDISKWQDTYDAATAKAQGIDDVILRAAYGTSKDVKFDTFYAAAKAAGQTVGAYGFATWHYSSKNGGDIGTARSVMIAQTNAWIDICKDKLDGYFAIDQELESGYSMGLTASDNEILLNECTAMLEAAGFTVCVYCSASWAMAHFNKDNIGADLWIAYYYADPTDPDFGQEANYETANGTYFAYMRSCGAQLMGWQFGRIGYGAKYGVGSDNVDRNVFYKSAVEKAAYEPLSEAPVRMMCGYASAGDVATLADLFASLLIAVSVADGYLTTVEPVSKGDQATIVGACAGLGIPCVIYVEAEPEPEVEVLPEPEVEEPEAEPDIDQSSTQHEQLLALVKKMLEILSQ